MATAEKQSYPKALWSANPAKRSRIFIPNPDNLSHIVRTIRFREGNVLVNNEYEETLIRRHMRGRVWEQDLEEPEIDEQSGWVCYSSKAFTEYLKQKRRLASAQPPR